jgi:hypothetical protein
MSWKGFQRGFARVGPITPHIRWLSNRDLVLDAPNRPSEVQYGMQDASHCRWLTQEQGELTKDPVYLDAERRFQELEKETKKLHEESKKFAYP